MSRIRLNIIPAKCNQQNIVYVCLTTKHFFFKPTFKV